MERGKKVYFAICLVFRFFFFHFLRIKAVNHLSFTLFSFHLLTSPVLSPLHNFRLLLPSILCVGNKNHWGRL